ncbi:MAG: hypothetical protein AAGJ28_00850 [Pseudomonadota bacterium]
MIFWLLRWAKIGTILSLPLAPTAAAQTINISLTVPETCISRAVPSGADALELHAFCNNARGGTVYAIASLDGDPLRLRVEGRTVEVRPGAQVALFSRTDPFHEKVAITLASPGDVSRAVGLLFRTVPTGR